MYMRFVPAASVENFTEPSILDMLYEVVLLTLFFTSIS